VVGKTKVLFFDIFNTVLNLASIPKEEVANYVANSRDATVWAPLMLPDSWLQLQPHDDAPLGLRRLRLNYTIVALSNAPLWFLSRVFKATRLDFDAIVPLETIQKYKPDPATYKFACDLLRVTPDEAMMITANPTFGDVEGSTGIGMRCQVLSRRENVKRFDLIDLSLSFRVGE
jgi:2-haloalkanoic acid dehalogenase type II